MTMTDPIADMLTRLRNASAVGKKKVEMPYSKFKESIVHILKNEGYVTDFKVEDLKVGKNLIVTLKYLDGDEPAIKGIKRISKPGLRKYAKSDNLPKVLGGLGVAIISSSAGIMTDKVASTKGVGGEVVAYVW
ncbi:MAG: 30S ribosomal protein S8 [Bifidobacteriaceae bacterium]|jgi:small subunit ribosomal protein S8|nr:30S ribosomal protein S8 [Bifidobacteriaceae bacterium]